MMSNKAYSFIALLATITVSCSIHELDQKDESAKVFYAQIEAPAGSEQTKVYADEDLSVLWHADDRVSIFDKNTYNQEYRFTGKTGANAGAFEKVANSGFVTGNALSSVYSVYPYKESTEISNQGVISVDLPATQSYSQNSFGLEANTMVSVSSDNLLMFKNVGGYLRLSLYGKGVSVSSITLKGNNGEKLAGQATVTMPQDGVPTIALTQDAAEEITLVCDSPVALGTTAEECVDFWFVVPPVTFSKGFTVSVHDSMGGTFEKLTSKSVAIERNKLSKMSPLDVVPVLPINKYLTFNSEGTTKISLSNYGNNAPVLYYSTDKSNWTLWDYSELTFTSDQPLYLCGDNPDGFSGLSTFVTSGSNFGVSGDIMAIIDSARELTAIPSPNCFSFLFVSCTGIISAPELPATTLADCCYSNMFEGCTSLTSTPELPATTLAFSCYANMFEGCTSLTSAPELPATTLARNCYSQMFIGCTSLTSTPELPATTLAVDCYSNMFEGCTSLTSTPELPATTLARNCYSNMFEGCTGLTSAPELPASTLAVECYRGMFIGCTSLTIAPELPATTLARNCYLSMFNGCTSLTTAPELPATTLADGCYSNMFVGCTSLTTAPELPATTLANSCYYAMFRRCTSLTSAPELPAPTLAIRCYNQMFWFCKQIDYIKCLATDISAEYCLSNWLAGVASTGTFFKASGMNDWSTGSDGIPEGWTVIDDSPVSVLGAVDLGLSVLWATCNLGASSPEEYGDYFAWGETVTKNDYSWSTYKWCNGSKETLTKYNSDSSYGSVDNKAELELEDDAAYVTLGSNWRMPTMAEWDMLCNEDNFDWTWTNNYAGTGVTGYIVTSKISGYEGKNIFLPSVGHWVDTYLDGAESGGEYWSSSIRKDKPYNAYEVGFNSGGILLSSGNRGSGKAVRPVCAE